MKKRVGILELPQPTEKCDSNYRTARLGFR